jgi:hypothetical protein
MAKQQGKVYLGYEDDVIGEKNQAGLNYTVNKIGGMPVSLLFIYNRNVIVISEPHV